MSNLNIVVLSLMIGLAPVYAQHEQGQHGQAHVQQSKPSAQHPAQQHQPKSRTQPQQHQAQNAWQEHKARNWESEHRTWAARGGYSGYRIPDDRFRRSFGREHRFRISRFPFRMFGGFPGFQCNGFWFVLVDPYPFDWGDGWYDTDDVYIVYEGDGYYLYNYRHPGIAIALNVSM